MNQTAMNQTAEFDAFLLAVGEAITNWSRIETGLFEIFHEAIHCPALRPSSAAFVAVNGFRAKLSMVDATLRSSRKYQPHIKTWEALQKRCESESKERNRLAHSKVFLLEFGKGPAKAVLGSYDHDMTFLTAAGRPDRRKIKGVSNVRHINQRFVKLGYDLGAFAQKIHQP